MPFSEREIQEAIFACDGNKAPGPDGFSLAAIHEGWDWMKEDLMKVFGNFLKMVSSTLQMRYT